MDVVSELLNTVAIQEARWDCHEVKAPFVIRRPAGGLHFLALSDGECRVDTADHAPVAFRRGQVVSLPQGNHHVIRNASAALADSRDEVSSANLIAVQFELGHSEIPPVLRVLPTVVRLADDPMTGWLVATLASMTLNASRPAPGSSAIAERLAQVMCVQLLRSCFPSATEAQSLLRGLTHPQLARALSLIHGCPEADWTVGSLAREVGMSRSAFAGRFTSRVGMPPLHYIGHVRMKRAAELLGGNAMSLNEVAASVGYRSDAAFSKAFMRHFGCAPRAYHLTSQSAPAAA